MKLRRFTMILLSLLSLLLWGNASAQFDHQHKAWSELLKKHVVVIDGGKASQVRYAALAKDRDALKSYLASLSKVSEPEFRSWDKEQQLAFLINAYNAHMIELILTRYPNLNSVWDFGKIFNNPFKNRFFTLLGRPMHLDNIEHDTIRARGVFDEPRIHFAVSCASIGCPMLRDEAYVADRLDQQLENQVVQFLSDRSRNRYNAERNALEVSEIFKWYAEDFSSGLKSINSREQFFASYASLLADHPEHQKLIRDQKADIRFFGYHWGLNDAKR